MGTIKIEGRKVNVSDNFFQLSREKQNETVDEIAASLGIKPSRSPVANQRVGQGFDTMAQQKPATPELQEDIVGRAQGSDARFNPSMLDAGATGAAQSLTFGTSDEIQAALQSGFGLLADYDETHKNVQAEMKAAQDKYPWLFFGGEIAGGVGNAAALVKSGLSAPARAVGKGFRKRAGAAAIDGAVAGAAYGAGTGDGWKDRRNRAMVGGGVGRVAGPVAEGVGNQIGKVFARKGPGTEAVEEAAEFGIPLTRGQATGNLKQQQFEEAGSPMSSGASPITRSPASTD